jgi:hypothetical protein
MDLSTHSASALTALWWSSQKSICRASNSTQKENPKPNQKDTRYWETCRKAHGKAVRKMLMEAHNRLVAGSVETNSEVYQLHEEEHPPGFGGCFFVA